MEQEGRSWIWDFIEKDVQRIVEQQKKEGRYRPSMSDEDIMAELNAARREERERKEREKKQRLEKRCRIW